MPVVSYCSLPNYSECRYFSANSDAGGVVLLHHNNRNEMAMINCKCLFLLVVVLVGGCAGMDKSQCLTADWRTVGFEDGSNGKPESAIGS